MTYNFEQLSRHSHMPESPEYKKIKQVISDLYKRGLLERFDGECIAAADILQHSLESVDISSKIVECQLSVVSSDPRKGIIWRFIGFDDNLSTNGVDTHAVVITESESPWIIDISIAKTIGGTRPWIVEKLNKDDALTFAQFKIDDLTLTYHPKFNPRLIGLHQKNLLDRIRSQKRIENTLTLLKILVSMLIIIASINFIRGTYDFYQTYIIDSNNWGPTRKE